METISIVGGGIAGLALAACLDESQFRVSVYEKRPGLPAVGSALGMWPSAQRALARLGILDEARAASPVIRNGSVRNAAGRPWVRLAPYLAVRGTVPFRADPDDVGEYWGRGDLFGIAAAPAGSFWYASYRSGIGPYGIDTASVLGQARERYSGHAPAIRQVLAAATPEDSLVQRLWTTPRLKTFVLGNVVLAGDAAHAMFPTLGRGACESLVDAVTLAGLLNRLPQKDALQAYDRQRRLRTRALGVAAAALLRVALADDAQPLRDRVLNLARRRNGRAAVGSGTAA